MESIFSKIIKGELPCYQIYQDSKVFAFLDIRPLNLGHTLLVPREQIDDFLDVPPPLYLKVMEEAKKISRAIKRATKAKRIGLIVQGFEVPHFHIHLIPINSPKDMILANAIPREEEEMKSIREKIVQELGIA